MTALFLSFSCSLVGSVLHFLRKSKVLEEHVWQNSISESSRYFDKYQ